MTKMLVTESTVMPKFKSDILINFDFNFNLFNFSFVQAWITNSYQAQGVVVLATTNKSLKNKGTHIYHIYMGIGYRLCKILWSLGG